MAVKNAKITATKKQKQQPATPKKFVADFLIFFWLIRRMETLIQETVELARSFLPLAPVILIYNTQQNRARFACRRRPLRRTDSQTWVERRGVCERRVHLGLSRAKKIIGVGSIRRKMDGGGIRPYFAHTY